MNYSSSHLKSPLGHKLFTHKWQTEKANAQVIIVHGLAEHGFRYGHFAGILNKAGIDVVSYDHFGHGRSEGLRCYIPRFDVYIDDLRFILQSHIRELPTFLFGHSMGGLIATKYCIAGGQKDLAGLITSGAALKLDDNLSPLLKKLAPLLSFLLPKLPTQALEKKYVTRDPKVLEAYLNDPLVYQKGIRARLGHELLKSIDTIHRSFHLLNLPLLALHGQADKLVDPRGTENLYLNAGSKDKMLNLYPGLYHEIINEPEGEDVMSDIRDWMLARV